MKSDTPYTDPAPELETSEATAADTAKSPRTVRALMNSWNKKTLAFAPAQAHAPYLYTILIAAAVTVILSAVLFIGGRSVYFGVSPAPNESVKNEVHGGGVAAEGGDRPFADGPAGSALIPWAEQVQIIPAESISASHAALADLATGEIIASRQADKEIFPASMTKVMTLIVVVENLPSEQSLKENITISREVYEEMKRQGASGVGFETGEVVSVESLLYALMLKSDGIAACELARYVAGSEEDFVELMNQKAEKMGLSNTHFENPTGLHHPNHKSTAREIASIMSYAMKMQLCRQILKTQSYSAPFTMATGEQKNYYLYHNLIVTQFDKVQPNQPNAVTVVAGKTGFTDEGYYCLVTYAETAEGHGYVCVTAETTQGGYAACIADYLTIYNTYVKP